MTARKAISKTTGTMAAMALSLLASTWQAAAQEVSLKPMPASITVSGIGQAEAKPDLARIIVSVSTEADTVPKASTANKEASDKVIAGIRGLAIPANDIKTVDMQVFRSYDSGKSKLSSSSPSIFRAEHQIEIVLRDTATVGRIVGELLSIENMTLQTINWDVNNSQDVEDKARANAVADARHRAEIYAAAANVKLGRLLTIRDDARSNEPIAYQAMAAASPKNDAAMPIIPPAALTFRATAQMIWEIAP